MDSSLQQIFNAAKDALRADAKQTILSGMQSRQNQFAKINNQANSRHMLFSGMPKAMQMQYDQSTFIPNMASSVVSAIKSQAENQKRWDEFAANIKEMNDAAAELEAAVPSGA
jgi:isocitrate dehydrogenase kinase/phosphatase